MKYWLVIVILTSTLIFGLFAYTSIGNTGINKITNKAIGVKDPTLKLELVAEGLEFPTSMDFLAPDDILVLEN